MNNSPDMDTSDPQSATRSTPPPETIRQSVIRIAGNSQDGIQSVGHMLARLAGRSDMEVMTYMTIPATISGGPSIFQVHMGTGEVLSAGDASDLLVAFYQHSYDTHIESVSDGGVLLYDSTDVKPDLEALSARRITPVGVPITALTIEVLGGTGKQKGKNIFLLGLLSRIFKLDLKKVKKLLQEQFGQKDESIFRNATLALDAGYSYSIGDLMSLYSFDEPQQTGKLQVTMNGNQALAYGCIAAGVRFGAGYPITPWTDVMEQLREMLPAYGGSFIQTEDELAAISAALGGSYAGLISMTGSSGPGISLKSEAISYAVMAELPLLIVDVQRGGPSTGLPTNVEQSDFELACHAGHGDSPRLVVAPSRVKDCFYLVIDAVRLAWKYRLPVIFLSDQSLATRIEAFSMPDIDQVMQDPPVRPDTVASYKPYALDCELPPLVPPGTRVEDGDYANITGLEHDEKGHPSANPKMHATMTAKRRRKLAAIAGELPCPKVYGPEKGDTLIVGWGSTEGVIREAVDRAATQGRTLSALHLRYLNPLPHGLEAIFLQFKRVVVVELNDGDPDTGCGQVGRYLRGKFCLKHITGLTKTDGLTFRVREILAGLPDSVTAQSTH